jgi:hypothetical protein
MFRGLQIREMEGNEIGVLMVLKAYRGAIILAQRPFSLLHVK